jgi:hypothetical protein
MAGNLIPGAGMVQNIIEKMSDQIVAMVDEIITEKADAMIYDIIKPQIAEQMEAIFKSAPVQMEASKMFNRELFPIYKQTLEDFANFNSLVKDANQDIDKAIEEYANAIIANNDNTNKKNEAKQKLMATLKGVSDKKTGNVLSMKGGDLQSFLGNVDNQFKPVEGGNPATKYLGDGTNLISQAIEEIVGGLKNSREDLKTNIEESTKNNATFGEKRRKAMRKPKPKLNIGKITQSLGNQANDTLANIGKEVTGIKMGGGKSKRRRHRKQHKTYKKRR